MTFSKHLINFCFEWRCKASHFFTASILLSDLEKIKTIIPIAIKIKGHNFPISAKISNGMTEYMMKRNIIPRIMNSEPQIVELLMIVVI